ncbi:MAG: hypothetical protein H6R17_27 [Proteobacteria bacterium]|nr:hypothetical protein [Pseudomonadota bacterium]
MNCLRAQQALVNKSFGKGLSGDALELKEIVTPEGRQIEVLASGRGGNWIGVFLDQIFLLRK